uniref:Angiotensin-converting enzyme n=1 Tax=Clastoptera arizonana TaxID=38151 RepID=A0A1B6E167_9HEMI
MFIWLAILFHITPSIPEAFIEPSMWEEIHQLAADSELLHQVSMVTVQNPNLTTTQRYREYSKMVAADVKALTRLKKMWDVYGRQPWNSYEEVAFALDNAKKLQTYNRRPMEFRLAEVMKVFKQMHNIREYLTLEGIFMFRPVPPADESVVDYGYNSSEYY